MGAFGVFFLDAFRCDVVLRDVVCVLQFWSTREEPSIAINDFAISFRCVFFVVLVTCVRGEHDKFVSGGIQSIE